MSQGEEGGGPDTVHAEVIDGFEDKVRKLNREVIHRRIPGLNAQTVLEMAATVAELRARYIESALRLKATSKNFPPDPPVLNDVRQKREMFEEAVHAFNALARVIRRGYVDIGR